MPTSKAKKDERVAAGKCSLCDRKLKSKRFCAEHLKYFQRYNAAWREENGTAKGKHKCSICRGLGHTYLECKDPRAAEIRALMGATVTTRSNDN